MTWKLFGLLGYPVAHSFSPDLMNTLARRHGFHFGYHAFSVPPEQLEMFFEAVRLLPVHGFNVTAPHKRAVVRYCEIRSEAVALTGASNCVVNRDGRLEAHNTDVPGFLWGLKHFSFAGTSKAALLLGAGGAARAVAFALAEAGFEEVAIASRNPAREAEWRKECPQLFGRVRLRFFPWEEELLIRSLKTVQLVVQCTPVGTWPHSGDVVPFPFEHLGPEHAVYDLVYNPPQTEFLRRAEAQGAAVQNGLAMLAAQAAEALKLWGYSVSPREARNVLQELLPAGQTKSKL